MALQPKQIDDLNKEELMDLIVYHGQHPRITADKLFPGIPGRYKFLNIIRNYCWNKYTALNLPNDKDNRLKYIQICADIYCQLPDQFRIINIHLIPRRDPKCT